MDADAFDLHRCPGASAVSLSLASCGNHEAHPAPAPAATSIFIAAETGDLFRLRSSLTSQNIDSTDAAGYTPMMLATKGGQVAAMRCLVSTSANVGLGWRQLRPTGIHLPMKDSLATFKSVATMRWGFFALIGFVLGSLFTYSTVSWSSRDRQGESNGNCDKFAGPSIANGKATTASLHTTACTTLGTSVVGYLYVHPTDQGPRVEHLVLTYSQSGVGESPTIQWTDERHLVVEVSHVSQASKIQTSSGAISIDFRIHAD